MSKKPKKNASLSVDWALLFILFLSVCTNVFTVIRYRRFVREVDDINRRTFADVRKSHEQGLNELRSVVNDFIGRSSSLAPVQQVYSESVNTNKFELPSLSPLPDGLWVSCVNGEWLLTDGHYSYSVGSLSPVGSLLSCTKGIVKTDRGLYYSIFKESRGVAHE